MRRHIVRVSLLLLGIGLLAGCGQKGPLVLPTKPAAPTATPAVPASAASAAKPAGAATAAPASATSGA